MANPNLIAPEVSEEQKKRFWDNVALGNPDDCWLWRRSLKQGDYGQVTLRGRKISAHVLAWFLSTGKWPDGMHVCHSCDSRYPAGDKSYRRCCNPAHLWLGTHQENMEDCKNKGRQAAGDRHSSKTHPERMARGDKNGSRKHPERRPKGESHGMAKLNEEQVREIRLLFSAGRSKGSISRQFGVSRAAIRDIILGRKWKHLE